MISDLMVGKNEVYSFCVSLRSHSWLLVYFIFIDGGFLQN